MIGVPVSFVVYLKQVVPGCLHIYFFIWWNRVNLDPGRLSSASLLLSWLFVKSIALWVCSSHLASLQAFIRNLLVHIDPTY